MLMTMMPMMKMEIMFHAQQSIYYWASLPHVADTVVCSAVCSYFWHLHGSDSEYSVPENPPKPEPQGVPGRDTGGVQLAVKNLLSRTKFSLYSELPEAGEENSIGAGFVGDCLRTFLYNFLTGTAGILRSPQMEFSNDTAARQVEVSFKFFNTHCCSVSCEHKD